jgi:hypothetical protein
LSPSAIRVRPRSKLARASAVGDRPYDLRPPRSRVLVRGNPALRLESLRRATGLKPATLIFGKRCCAFSFETAATAEVDVSDSHSPLEAAATTGIRSFGYRPVPVSPPPALSASLESLAASAPCPHLALAHEICASVRWVPVLRRRQDERRSRPPRVKGSVRNKPQHRRV